MNTRILALAALLASATLCTGASPKKPPKRIPQVLLTARVTNDNHLVVRVVNRLSSAIYITSNKVDPDLTLKVGENGTSKEYRPESIARIHYPWGATMWGIRPGKSRVFSFTVNDFNDHVTSPPPTEMGALLEWHNRPMTDADVGNVLVPIDFSAGPTRKITVEVPYQTRHSDSEHKVIATVSPAR